MLGEYKIIYKKNYQNCVRRKLIQRMIEKKSLNVFFFWVLFFLFLVIASHIRHTKQIVILSPKEKR